MGTCFTLTITLGPRIGILPHRTGLAKDAALGARHKVVARRRARVLARQRQRCKSRIAWTRSSVKSCGRSRSSRAGSRV
jgi:hypothetical protein